MEREARYCTTKDGARIAYGQRGTGPLVVVCPQFVESFALVPTYEPTVEAFFKTLESEWTIALYDTRGTGASQRDGIEHLGPDAQSLDLEAVIDAVGGKTYGLIAWTLATSVALRYVLRCPGTVSRLIIGNGGTHITDGASPEAIAAFGALARTNWPIAAQTFADMGPRDEEPGEAMELARIVRDSTTGETVARMFEEAVAASGITGELAKIDVATLVMHHLDNVVTPVSVARSIAAAIPNARLSLLAGRSGWYTQGNALESMQRFLRDGGPPNPRDATIRVEQQSFAAGRYVVVRPLGTGGQKSVFLVHDNALDRDCALALIRSEQLEPDDLLRFQREAQAMARLGAHSNIVSVFDIGEQDGRPFLVSEFVSGGDLRQRLLTHGRLPVSEALAIGGDIARALAVAHARGVIHRDVKPPNIWLTEDGTAKLGDFGLAFSIDRSRMTMPGTVMGTAAYLAPEQALGEPVTERSDLYALGCVLYEMVCGQPPFADDNPTAVIAQHLNATPSAPSTRNLHVPRALEDLILRLLAKSPPDRPQTAAAVVDQLRRISLGAAVSEASADPPSDSTFVETTAKSRHIDPQIQYCKASDGVSIAYGQMGSGPLLIIVPNVPLTHTQLAPQVYPGFLEGLSERFHVLWYDARGSGLSDREPLDFSLDAMVRDLEAVIRAAGEGPCALFASFAAVPIAITYASTRPANLTHLILADGYVRQSEYLQSSIGRAERALLDQDWTLFTDAYSRVFFAMDDPDEARRASAYIRDCVEAEAWRAAEAAADGRDVSALLRQITVPTLVISDPSHRWLTIKSGQQLAACIAGARFAISHYLSSRATLVPLISEFVLDRMS